MEETLHSPRELEETLEQVAVDEEGQTHEWEDATPCLGWRVDWHGEILLYTEYGLEKIFTCATCGGEPRIMYINRGAPGWCYVYDRDGHFLADLRNQDYYCSVHDHTKGRTEG